MHQSPVVLSAAGAQVSLDAVEVTVRGGDGQPVHVSPSNPFPVKISSADGVTIEVNEADLANVGAKADAAWAGSGDGSMIAILKAEYAKIEASRALLDGLLKSPAGYAAGVTLNPLGLLKEIPFGPIVLGATSYPVKSTIGGLIAIDVSAAVGRDMANQPVREAAIRFVMSGTTVTAAGSIIPALFSANPTATTFTDGAAVALAAADQDKLAVAVAVAAQGGNSFFDGVAVYYAAYATYNAGRLTCDATGKIYMSLQASGASTLTGTGGIVGSLLLGYDPA